MNWTDRMIDLANRLERSPESYFGMVRREAAITLRELATGLRGACRTWTLDQLRDKHAHPFEYDQGDVVWVHYDEIHDLLVRADAAEARLAALAEPEAQRG
jgi:hypothetical protein